MKFTSVKALAVVATLLSAGSASAVTLNLDAGWDRFAFGAVGTMAKRTFTFTLAGFAKMTIVDGFKAGDRLQVFANNISLGLTSVPTPGGPSIGQNYDAALTMANFSSWTHRFGPGSYTITMLVKQRSGNDTADHLSGIRLYSAPVPVPAAGLMLLSALGAAGAMRKRRKAAL